MNTILPPKAVFRSVTRSMLTGKPWSGSWIGNPYLRQHTRILAKMFRVENRWTRRLQAPCLKLLPVVEARTTLLTQVDRNNLNVIPVLLRLAEYQEDWIRDPESWQPDKQLQPRTLLISLIQHLLNRYELPDFCNGAWFIDGALNHIERDWYCHLARGGSIRHFPGWLPKLTRQASKYFLSAADDMSMRDAVRYGQVMALFHDEKTVAYLLTTRIGLNFSHDAVWLPLLEMLASDPKPIDFMELVIDYLWAKCELHGTRSVRLRGRTLETLYSSASNFFKNLGEQSGFDSTIDKFDIASSNNRSRLLQFCADQWQPMESIKPFEESMGGWLWQMVELNRQDDLQEEARDMQHCVADYGWDCKDGKVSIFSLRSRRLEGGALDRDVTLEVNCQSRKLQQVKAWRNRRPSDLTRKMVLRWCVFNQINPGAYTMW